MFQVHGVIALVAEVLENVANGCQNFATAWKFLGVNGRHPVTKVISAFREAGRQDEEIEVQGKTFENIVEPFNQEFVDC